MNPDRQAELEEQRRFLLRSISDLDAERAAGDVEDVDYATLHDGYVARAAAVLREIEDGKAALPLQRRRPLRTVAAVVATLAIAGVGGWAVAHFSGQRTEDSAGVAVAEDENTKDLSGALQAAAAGDYNSAIAAYQRVLDRDPANVEARTYFGWLLVQDGTRSSRPHEVDLGIGLIRDAIAADTTYADAHCLLGVSLARFVATPDAAAATSELDACLASNPPSLVRQLVEPVRQALDASESTAVVSGPAGTSDPTPVTAPVATTV